jgi:hypothetical protein
LDYIVLNHLLSISQIDHSRKIYYKKSEKEVINLPQKRPRCYKCGDRMVRIDNAEAIIIPKPNQTMYAAAYEQGYATARRHDVWDNEIPYFYRCDNKKCPNYKPKVKNYISKRAMKANEQR